MDILTLLGYLALLYLALGVIVSIGLQFLGLHRIDASTKGTGLVFRLIISPGMVALWPLLVWKLARGTSAGSLESPVSPRGLRRLHGAAVVFIAITIPIVAGAGLFAAPPAAPITNEGVAWSLDREPSGTHVVVADVAHVPEQPHLVYWADANAGAPVFLGGIARAGVYRFAVRGEGTVRLYLPESGRWETALAVGPGA